MVNFKITSTARAASLVLALSTASSVIAAPFFPLLAMGIGALVVGEAGGIGCMLDSGGGCPGGKARLANEATMVNKLNNLYSNETRAVSQGTNQVLTAVQNTDSLITQADQAVAKQRIDNANTVGQASAAEASGAVKNFNQLADINLAMNQAATNGQEALALQFKKTSKYLDNSPQKSAADYASEFSTDNIGQ